MSYKGTGDPAFAYTTESLNNHASWPMLDIVRYVILDFRGFRKIKVFPDQIQEIPEVFKAGIHSGS